MITIPNNERSMTLILGHILNFSDALCNFYSTLNNHHCFNLHVGNDNDNRSDDFIYPNGTRALEASASEEEIYQWGLTWMTTAETTLFVYRMCPLLSLFQKLIV